MLDDFYLLQTVKGLRNACAHNNCIINDMASGRPRYKAGYAVSRALGKVGGIGADQRRAKMSNDRFQQIVNTLYMHKRLASQGVHEHKCVELAEFVKRMNRHLDYYAGNKQVLSGFEFLSKVIAAWYSVEGDAGALVSVTEWGKVSEQRKTVRRFARGCLRRRKSPIFMPL